MHTPGLSRAQVFGCAVLGGAAFCIPALLTVFGAPRSTEQLLPAVVALFLSLPWIFLFYILWGFFWTATGVNDWAGLGNTLVSAGLSGAFLNGFLLTWLLMRNSIRRIAARSPEGTPHSVARGESARAEYGGTRAGGRERLERKKFIMPTALGVISVVYATLAGLALVSTITAFRVYGALSASFPRIGITMLAWLLIDLIVRVSIIVGGVGLWRGTRWGWWLIACATGVQVLNKLVGWAFVEHRALLGAHLVQDIWLIIGVVVLGYLFSNRFFRTIHGESLARAKALAILVLVCVSVSALYQWQGSATREYLRSNNSLQPAPKDGAAERKR